MTEAEVQELLRALSGARLFVASEEDGSPEAAWGDTFCYYDPDGTEDQKWPFATIVTHDTPGWDEVSDLDRPDAFRLNLHVGREHVPPVSDAIDYSRRDTILPHPQYAAQGWVAIVNPADRDEVAQMTSLAHHRAAVRQQA
ncbi:MAG TPA: DUF6194 family protein [Euzebyales bacterium]|nr:DUF6194 family protein [Euzebyales bacterium]